MAWTIPDKGVAIYFLRDGNEFQCRYVGKSREPRKRLRAHMTESRGACRTHRAKWIRSLAAAPIMEIVEWCPDENDANAREVWWIAEMRRRGCRLTNASDGGEGQAGYRHTEETKRRIGDAFRGGKRPADVVARIAAAHKGKRHALGSVRTPEQRQRYRNARLGKPNPFAGRKHTAETIARMKAARSAYWQQRRAQQVA